MENQNPYYSPQTSHEARPTGRLKHSGLGIISFLIAICSGIVEFVAVVAATVIGMSGQVDEQSVEIMLVGFGILGGMGLAMLGGVLGIVGLVLPNRSKLFPVLGLVFNGMVIVGIAGLIVLGLCAG